MSERVPEWPKRLPELSEEQEKIREDFYKLWLERLPRNYKLLERFDHVYPARRWVPDGRTLEIGIGLGTQLEWEDLDRQEYVGVELREDHVKQLHERFPEVQVEIADAQQQLPFETDSFDRVNAVHVLEHLPNLPAALDEIDRVLKPTGRLVVVIPCEHGKMHEFARRISSKPLFEKRYGTSYDWFIATEHCNVPWEIEYELKQRFKVGQRRWFPFWVPSVNLNLVYGLTCTRPAEK